MGTLYVAHYMWGGALPLLFDRFGVLWAFRDFTDFTDFTIKFNPHFSLFVSLMSQCSIFVRSISVPSYRGSYLTVSRTYRLLGILRSNRVTSVLERCLRTLRSN